MKHNNRHIRTEVKLILSALGEIKAALLHVSEVLEPKIKPMNKIRKVPHRNQGLNAIERNKDAKKMAIELLENNLNYKQVYDELNRHIPNFKTSRSAICRFWINHRRNQMNNGERS